MTTFTAAFCTYNRADRLPALVAALRAQQCPCPFNILVVDNNSTDETQQVLKELAALEGPELHYVREEQQGIPYARNRALDECLRMGSTYMLFMDDDELPGDALLAAAFDALEHEGAEVAGGRVAVRFANDRRPSWLEDDLLGFLAEIEHGDEPFWVTDFQTPLWTANIAYRMEIFKQDPGLRFDERYNRAGDDIGGGEDAVIFRAMLARGLKIRYRPDMVVEHFVEGWRLKRSYFLRLHYLAGKRFGLYQADSYSRTVSGVPPFLLRQALAQGLRALGMAVLGRPGVIRQAMNSTYSFGMMRGLYLRSRGQGGV